MMSDFLRAAGYSVLEAENADEALKVLQSGAEVDLVFSDIIMPGSMDGCLLARCVHGSWPDTKVLLTSGYSSGRAKAEYDEENVLAKPYRPRQVLSAIEASFSR